MATAALGYTIGPLMAERWQARVIPLLLALALAFHGVEMVQFYWNGTYDRRDWNASWNDESFRAARWMAVSLPRGAKIGSWNAGVVGYYTPQTVVNLDGVINNFDLLPYLERGAVHEYILRDRLTYLSDMDSMFEAHRLRERLHLTEVYSHYSPLLGQYYRIYRVDP